MSVFWLKDLPLPDGLRRDATRWQAGVGPCPLQRLC
jgi:hypothetical protein